MRFLWILLFCAASAAQQAAAQPAEAPKPARVTGRTLNPKGEPLRRSIVRLVGAQTYTQSTGERGEFVFDNVAPGTYALLGSRRGYYTQKYGAKLPLVTYCATADMTEQDGLAPGGVIIQKQCYGRAPGTMLTLAAGEELKELRVSLSPLASITGRVTTQDGEPAAAWRVIAMAFVYHNGKGTLSGSSWDNSGVVDTEGNYSLDGVTPGRYYLLASSQRSLGGAAGIRPAKPSSESDQSTFYPATPDVSSATLVEVSAGSEITGMDIRLNRSKVYSIRGKLSDQAGSQTKSQILTMQTRGAATGFMSQRTARTRDDGSFEFRDIAPGTYLITAGQVSLNGVNSPTSGRQEVTVSAGDVEGVVVPLLPGVDFEGTIRVEGKPPQRLPYVALLPVDDQYSAFGADPDAKGVLKSNRTIPRGTFYVRVSGLASGFYVKSVTCGKQDLLHAPLDLTGGACGSLDIVLSANGATISGKVANGAVVTIWPRRADLVNPMKSAGADQNGCFEVSDLASGEYFVAALEDVDPGLMDAREFFEKFQDSAVVVTVEEGGHANADVKLVPAARVAAEAARMR